MNPPKELTKPDFYQASSDWMYSMYHSHTVWLKRALLSLMIVTALLCLSLLANVTLIPLKEKVPYLYAFDHATGEITKIGALEATTLSANWELSRFFLIHYVINYEGYDFDNLDRPYQLVFAQSSDNVKREYVNSVKSDNLHSPYRLYGKDKFITVRVIAINRLNDNTVDVKFEKKLHDRTSNTEAVIQKEAIIKWKYEQAQTTQTMLDRDPLGFKVIYYQSNIVFVNDIRPNTF